MKYKTTDREQRQNNGIVLGFSYCSIQNIERYLSPNAYTAGIYGWRADFYELSDFTISTGYAPLNFIHKTGYKDIDAYRTKKAEVLRKGLLEIEKKLNKNGYKWQSGGSWERSHKFFMRTLEKLIKKARAEAEEEAKKYRD